MRLHNIMEDRVINITDDLMKGEKDFCTCDRCKLDVIALSLNSIKPRYVVTEKGELYGRTNMMNSQFDVDIVKEVTRSIDRVRKSPRHN